MPAPYFNFLVQRLTKRLVRGCENFVLALASLLCLALPGSCSARFTYLFLPLCSLYNHEISYNSATLGSYLVNEQWESLGSMNHKNIVP